MVRPTTEIREGNWFLRSVWPPMGTASINIAISRGLSWVAFSVILNKYLLMDEQEFMVIRKRGE
jgi:hypothetical protein